MVSRGLVLLTVLMSCRPLPSTIGAACDEVIDAICDRKTECGIQPRSDCVTENVRSDCCAAKGICAGPTSDPRSAVQCADGIRATACTSIADDQVPGYCATATDVKDAFVANP